MQTQRTHTSRNAFTLIEMLVVIAIIALLVSLIFPAIQSTLIRARTIECQSNQNQIAKAMLQYPVEHDGELPWAQARANQVGFDDNWAGVLVREGYLDAPTTDDPDDIPAQSVFKCPEGLDDEVSAGSPADSPWTTNPNGHRPWPAVFEMDGETVYVHNWYGINGRTEANFGSNQGWPFIRTQDENQRVYLAEVTLPSRTVMIYDGNWMHNSSANRILARHGPAKNKTVMVFFDGSVQVLETRIFSVSDRDTRDLFPRFRNYRL